MALILSLDVESTGLIPSGISKGDAQFPSMVEIGLVLFDLDGRNHGVFGARVKLDGQHIHPGATAVHGITSRDAAREGLSEIAALGTLCGFAGQAEYLIGYSVGFDRDICESALIKLGKNTRMLMRPGLQVVDLITPCTAVCKIPSEHESGGYRWPTLDAARQIILGEPKRDGSHNALEDAMISKRLFLSLRERGMVDLGEPS